MCLCTHVCVGVGVQGQLKALKDQSTKAIGAAGEEWAGLVTAAAQSASRAVSALSSTAATLQAQLDAEQQAHQDTRNDVSGSASPALCNVRSLMSLVVLVEHGCFNCLMSSIHCTPYGISQSFGACTSVWGVTVLMPCTVLLL